MFPEIRSCNANVCTNKAIFPIILASPTSYFKSIKSPSYLKPLVKSSPTNSIKYQPCVPFSYVFSIAFSIVVFDFHIKKVIKVTSSVITSIARELSTVNLSFSWSSNHCNENSFSRFSLKYSNHCCKRDIICSLPSA